MTTHTRQRVRSPWLFIMAALVVVAAVQISGTNAELLTTPFILTAQTFAAAPDPFLETVKTAFRDIAGVENVTRLQMQGSTLSGEVTVALGAARIETAEALARAALQVWTGGPLTLSFILDDGDQAIEYGWSPTMRRWSTLPLTRETSAPRCTSTRACPEAN